MCKLSSTRSSSSGANVTSVKNETIVCLIYRVTGDKRRINSTVEIHRRNYGAARDAPRFRIQLARGKIHFPPVWIVFHFFASRSEIDSRVRLELNGCTIFMDVLVLGKIEINFYSNNITQKMKFSYLFFAYYIILI